MPSPSTGAPRERRRDLQRGWKPDLDLETRVACGARLLGDLDDRSRVVQADTVVGLERTRLGAERARKWLVRSTREGVPQRHVEPARGYAGQALRAEEATSPQQKRVQVARGERHAGDHRGEAGDGPIQCRQEFGQIDLRVRATFDGVIGRYVDQHERKPVDRAGRGPHGPGRGAKTGVVRMVAIFIGSGSIVQEARW